MNTIHIPQAPHWNIDWPKQKCTFPILNDLHGVMQSPTFHGEGDVYTHTTMVCDELVANENWRALPIDLQKIVFLAALLHDVGKITSTQNEDGEISSRGHSRRGAFIAQKILWELDVPFQQREHVVNLIAYHQVPFWILDRDNPEQLTRKISQTVRCDLLAILAHCDANGRVASDLDNINDNISLFEELAKSLDCFTSPAYFASDYGKFLYFRDKWTMPAHAPYESPTCQMILMSGLPGAGKDYWIHCNHPQTPVVSLDGIRRSLNISPADNQGRVIQIAKEQAKKQLRKSKSFIWNATNLTTRIRATLLDLALQYRAAPKIVYIEPMYQQLHHQNIHREYAVPQKIMSTFIDHRWEVPKPYEAIEMEYIINQNRTQYGG